jgi:hypothetical protein
MLNYTTKILGFCTEYVQAYAPPHGSLPPSILSKELHPPHLVEPCCSIPPSILSKELQEVHFTKHPAHLVEP